MRYFSGRFREEKLFKPLTVSSCSRARVRGLEVVLISVLVRWSKDNPKDGELVGDRGYALVAFERQCASYC